jgi:hypothetical protein
VFDESISFDGDIGSGFYYVNSDIFLPFKVVAWCDVDLVYYAYH